MPKSHWIRLPRKHPNGQLPALAVIFGGTRESSVLSSSSRWVGWGDMPPRRYYFRSKDGSTLGPVSLNVVAEMIRSDKVKANTPISVDGDDFRPMKSFPELATLLSVDVETVMPGTSEEAAVMDDSPTYSGTLSEVSFPKLLFHFIVSKAIGRLVLFNQTVKKEIFLVNGKPVAATSTLKRDQLGQHLVRSGVLTDEQLKQVLSDTSENHQRLGDYLIQRGIVNPHELLGHLQQQMLQKIYEVFFWRVGRYSFYDGQEYTGSLLPMNLNPWEVIVEGVRQGYERGELKEVLEPYSNRFILPGEYKHVHPSQLGLQPVELKVFNTAGAHRTVGGLLSRIGINQETEKKALSMIYLGLELGLLVLGEEAQAIHSTPEDRAAAEEWDQEMDSTDVSAEREVPGGFTATPPVSPEEEELLKYLNELKENNFFERLGLETTAGSSEVSKSFLSVARTYHPDNVPREAPERVHSLYSEIFSLLNEAQQKLTDDESRAAYLQALESGLEDDQVDVGNIIEAENIFAKGESLLNARKYAQALEQFEEAIKRNPEEGEFYIYRGYAMFMAKSAPEVSFANQCIQQIGRGLKMRGNRVASGFLFLGRIHKKIGNMENAQNMFRKALSIDPNHAEASSELRLISMRKEKKKFWRRK
jgi:tetratricopeptide (TPR) repeat protein